MSVKKSITKIKEGENIKCNLEYGLEGINFYVDYYSGIYVKYSDTKDLSDYEVSRKLLKLFYKLVDMEIPEIEKLLKVTISNNDILDKKGNKIELVLL